MEKLTQNLDAKDENVSSKFSEREFPEKYYKNWYIYHWETVNLGSKRMSHMWYVEEYMCTYWWWCNFINSSSSSIFLTSRLIIVISVIQKINQIWLLIKIWIVSSLRISFVFTHQTKKKLIINSNKIVNVCFSYILCFTYFVIDYQCFTMSF